MSFFADLRPFKPPALAVLVYFFVQCVICINKVKLHHRCLTLSSVMNVVQSSYCLVDVTNLEV